MVERMDRPAETIREAVGAFDDPKTLQAARSDLQSHGFDRANISYIARNNYLEDHLAQDYGDVRQAEDDPRAKRAAVVDEIDIRQRRTLDISTAATIAAFAAGADGRDWRGHGAGGRDCRGGGGRRWLVQQASEGDSGRRAVGPRGGRSLSEHAAYRVH